MNGDIFTYEQLMQAAHKWEEARSGASYADPAVAYFEQQCFMIMAENQRLRTEADRIFNERMQAKLS